MANYSIRYLDQFGCAVQTAFGVFDGDVIAGHHALTTIGSNAGIEVWKHDADPALEQQLVLCADRVHWRKTSQFRPQARWFYNG